jgi:hypothetical protein
MDSCWWVNACFTELLGMRANWAKAGNGQWDDQMIRRISNASSGIRGDVDLLSLVWIACAVGSTHAQARMTRLKQVRDHRPGRVELSGPGHEKHFTL